VATWNDGTTTGRTGAEFEDEILKQTFYNVAAYGGTGAGSSSATADNAAIAAALADAVSGGGGIIYIPEGDWYFTAAYNPGDNITWMGAGMGATILRQTVDATRLFTYSSTARNFVAFRDLTAYGMWEGNQTLGVDNDRHFAVNNYERVIYDNVESRYCRNMGITSTNCGTVVVRNCRVRYCARDAINLTNSRRCMVIGNQIIGCGDDGIAIHTSETATTPNPPMEGHTVIGNYVEDSYGIKLLGAVKAKIIGNTVVRPKGYGFYTGIVTTEGSNDVTDVVIQGNTVTDVINASKFGGGTIREGFYIQSSTTSFAAPVVPTTPTVTEPEALGYLSNTSIAQNAGGQRIVISGNIVAQTLPAVAAYTTWGYGEAFYHDGFQDIDLSTGFDKVARGINLVGALLSVSITDNTFENLASGIVVNDPITHIGDLDVVGNRFRRYSTHGITMETASVVKGRLRVVNNVFDADPLFESANRVAGGKWSTGAQSPTVLDIVNFEVAEVHGNTFRNINQILHTDGDSRILWGGNTYAWQPASAATVSSTSHADNRGIRVANGFGHPDARYLAMNSDPTDAGYGAWLGSDTSRTRSASSIPTAGYYVTGQFVRSTGITESGGVGDAYTILGWQRLTTGNAHVLDTDWRELRGLTGN
jgi:parallel beta-helix repeat protein